MSHQGGRNHAHSIRNRYFTEQLTGNRSRSAGLSGVDRGRMSRDEARARPLRFRTGATRARLRAVQASRIQIRRRVLRAPRLPAHAEHYSVFSFEIFVPSSVTPAINPLFVSTNASIGAVAVMVSTLPFAPTSGLQLMRRRLPTSLRCYGTD